LLAASTVTAVSAGPAPRVLLVGTWHGMAGGYSSVQQAVDAAHPGDWILVAPGDYHVADTARTGIRITTPGIHVRGLDRNGVIIDGTRPGTPRPCDSAATSLAGQPAGRNGVVVYKADGVSVENMTVCNWMAGSGGGGNQVWFNGGDGSGQIGLGRFRGDYLTAWNTFFHGFSQPLAQYGIFASNERGPGVIEHTAAANMADSAYYIGACPDCNVVLRDAHGQNSALGYSGSNSGGHLIIEGSEFDHNMAGMVPNSLNNDDAPSPQNGACPGGGTGPTGSHSCTIIRNNHVHDNNNPNVPAAGITAAAPVGSGIEISGGSNDTIIGNLVDNNGAWGVIIHDFPDTSTPPPVAHCTGGINLAGAACYFMASGNEVIANVFAHNGFFGNPGNGDVGNAASAVAPGNCFGGNQDLSGTLTSDPPLIQAVDGLCGGPAPGDFILNNQLLCDSSLVSSIVPGASCPSTPVTSYPRQTAVSLLALPKEATMPNPCAGVPANPWCPG
jgi:hypothetical protein